MYDRLEPFRELEYSANMELLLGTLNEQKKRKPSPIVNDMVKACLEVVYYVNGLHINRRAYEAIIREQANSNLELKIKIQELEKQLKKYEI